MTGTTGTNPVAITQIQKVVVVDGNAEVLGMLDGVLDAGRYDMVFVETSNHAYSQIKRVLPNLVIICARLDRPDAFQLLTMLALDAETRDIPIVTCPTEWDGENLDEAISRMTDDDEILVSARPELRMN